MLGGAIPEVASVVTGKGGVGSAALWPLACFTAQQTRSESHTVTSLVKVTAMTSACLNYKRAAPLFLPSLELVYRLV